MDPQTGQIYHLTFKPPPRDTLDRLIQRSDDTEEKARARLEVHAGNVASVLDYYQDCLVEVSIMCDNNTPHAYLISLSWFQGVDTRSDKSSMHCAHMTGKDVR